MNIHEYQAKAIFNDSGVKVVKGIHCTNVDEALNAYDELNSDIVAVKSQIHAGGRGKGKFKEGGLSNLGGVRVCKSSDEVRKHSEDMIGKTLITHQTGQVGKKVKRVYIEEGCEIENELY